MPGGDGTGPAGLGPMTGRAAGYCAGYPVPGYASGVGGRGFRGWGRGRGGGRGMGMGRGGGRGMGGGMGRGRGTGAGAAFAGEQVPPVDPGQDELTTLRQQAQAMSQQMQQIQQRIQQLEQEKGNG